MPEDFRRLGLDLGARSYDILVGPGLIPRAGALMHPVLAQKRVFVVSDQNVALLHLPALFDSLDEAGITHDHIVLPAGEQTKDFDYLEGVLDAMLDAKCERGTMLVALGGGVIGDLTGFAAAILLRGVDFIQIPTTLLAQVDSSVGGKTGINTRHGKNLVGSFHQPRLVIADTAALDTLPARELRAGYAEIVKYGCIDEPEFFTWLEAHGAEVLAGDSAARRHAIVTSCAAKARIVAGDERETGARALLNLGHTFGHALEAESGYGPDLLHGESVAIGMVMAFRLSARLGLAPAGDVARLERHLADLGIPTRPPPLQGRAWDPDRLLAHMAGDKKVKDGTITFILARGIGAAEMVRGVDMAMVRSVLAESI